MSATRSDTGRMHRWVTLVANIGVLIGILLLVVELDQNQTALRAQMRSELSADIVQLLTTLAENPELADLRRRADAGEPLDATETYRYEVVTRAFFRYWENVHYQYREGVYDDVEYSRQREAWRAYAGESAAAVSWWCAHRTEFSPEFAAEFDTLLPGGGCR